MLPFEGAKKVGADIICLPELYIGGGMMAHPTNEIWWRTVGERKEQTVAITVAITTRNRPIV